MYITDAHLSRIVDSIQSRGQYVTEQRMFSADCADSTIFLSHKHDEKTLLYKVKTLFENLGMSVYVDWMNSNMQHPTNVDTANEIRAQIRKQNKFILIASDAAISSPWCNWELGQGDAMKSVDDRIAILPIADNHGVWNHNEYLQIYPYIVYLDGTQKNKYGAYIPYGYYVLTRQSGGNIKYVTLTDWLKNGMPQRAFL